MSERQGLSNLAADARAALNRLIAGIRIVEVPPVTICDPEKTIFEIIGAANKVGFGIDPVHESIDFGFSPDFVQVDPGVDVVVSSVESSMEAVLDSVEILDTEIVEISAVQCDFPSPEILKTSLIEYSGTPEKIEDFRIRAVKVVDSTPEPLEKGRVVQVDVGEKYYARKDMEVILRFPMVLQPHPWSGFDKEFIVRCWDKLRNRAGLDRGRDRTSGLEMLAIFIGVDMSYVRRTTFDPLLRELRLYVQDPDEVNASKSGKCDIIFGIVKETGKIIRVAMPMETLSKS